ncbi:MAG: recombination regulator RecX [Actinomycetota bacterium]
MCAPTPQPQLDGATQALDAAMRYLGPASRSCWEVRRHLSGKGFDGRAVEAACVRLLELGILGDFAFAKTWAEQAVARRWEAAPRVAAALAARGVPGEVIAAALADVYPDEGGEGELERALAAGEQRLRVLHGSSLSVRRRLGSFLARRGYEMDVVVEVCNRLCAGQDAPGDTGTHH